MVWEHEKGEIQNFKYQNSLRFLFANVLLCFLHNLALIPRNNEMIFEVNKCI